MKKFDITKQNPGDPHPNPNESDPMSFPNSMDSTNQKEDVSWVHLQAEPTTSNQVQECPRKEMEPDEIISTTSSREVASKPMPFISLRDFYTRKQKIDANSNVIAGSDDTIQLIPQPEQIPFQTISEFPSPTRMTPSTVEDEDLDDVLGQFDDVSCSSLESDQVEVELEIEIDSFIEPSPPNQTITQSPSNQEREECRCQIRSIVQSEVIKHFQSVTIMEISTHKWKILDVDQTQMKINEILSFSEFKHSLSPFVINELINEEIIPCPFNSLCMFLYTHFVEILEEQFKTYIYFPNESLEGILRGQAQKVMTEIRSQLEPALASNYQLLIQNKVYDFLKDYRARNMEAAKLKEKAIDLLLQTVTTRYEEEILILIGDNHIDAAELKQIQDSVFDHNLKILLVGCAFGDQVKNQKMESIFKESVQPIRDKLLLRVENNCSRRKLEHDEGRRDMTEIGVSERMQVESDIQGSDSLKENIKQVDTLSEFNPIQPEEEKKVGSPGPTILKVTQVPIEHFPDMSITEMKSVNDPSSLELPGNSRQFWESLVTSGDVVPEKNHVDNCSPIHKLTTSAMDKKKVNYYEEPRLRLIVKKNCQQKPIETKKMSQMETKIKAQVQAENGKETDVKAFNVGELNQKRKKIGMLAPAPASKPLRSIESPTPQKASTSASRSASRLIAPIKIPPLQELPEMKVAIHLGLYRTKLGFMTSQGEFHILFDLENILYFDDHQMVSFEMGKADQKSLQNQFSFGGLLMSERLDEIHQVKLSTGKFKGFRIEEILSIFLTQLKWKAEFELKRRISECLIVVPQSLNVVQRNAVDASVKLAKFQRHSLINDTHAMALAFLLQDRQKGLDVNQIIMANQFEGFIDATMFQLDKNGSITHIATSGDFFISNFTENLLNLYLDVFTLGINRFLNPIKMSRKIFSRTSLEFDPTKPLVTVVATTTEQLSRLRLPQPENSIQVDDNFPLKGATYLLQLAQMSPEDFVYQKWLKLGHKLNEFKNFKRNLVYGYPDKFKVSSNSVGGHSLSQDELIVIEANHFLLGKSRLHDAKMQVLKILTNLQPLNGLEVYEWRRLKVADFMTECTAKLQVDSSISLEDLLGMCRDLNEVYKLILGGKI